MEDERGAPATEAVSGYIGISFIPTSGAGHRTWDDVARWYEGLAEARRAVTPAIEAKAAALTSGTASPYEKVLALAKFAQRDIRYVAAGACRYSARAKQEGQAVTFERTLTMATFVVSAGDYPILRKFAGNVQVADNDPVVMKR